jgi:hypothetical protein
MIKVLLSSCCGDEETQLPGWKGMVQFSREPVKFVDDPDAADFILVTGFDDRDRFRALRKNRIWRKYPEKSFGLFEGDNAPRYLHGLYCGVPRKWNAAGRFGGLAYRWHQQIFPNPVPRVERVRATEKDFLFAYVGRTSNAVRKRLLTVCRDMPGVHVEDSSGSYEHFGIQRKDRQSRQDRYWGIMSRAKYGLCPAGAAPSSVRLFELLEAGIAPVVIADQWVPPHGPDWDRFCLRVPESRIGEINTLVKAIEPQFEERGRLAREAWERFFSRERYFDFLIDSLRHIRRTQKVPERCYVAAVPYFLFCQILRRAIFSGKVSIKRSAAAVLRIGSNVRGQEKTASTI